MPGRRLKPSRCPPRERFWTLWRRGPLSLPLPHRESLLPRWPLSALPHAGRKSHRGLCLVTSQATGRPPPPRSAALPARGKGQGPLSEPLGRPLRWQPGHRDVACASSLSDTLVRNFCVQCVLLSPGGLRREVAGRTRGPLGRVQKSECCSQLSPLGQRV